MATNTINYVSTSYSTAIIFTTPVSTYTDDPFRGFTMTWDPTTLTTTIAVRTTTIRHSTSVSSVRVFSTVGSWSSTSTASESMFQASASFIVTVATSSAQSPLSASDSLASAATSTAPLPPEATLFTQDGTYDDVPSNPHSSSLPSYDPNNHSNISSNNSSTLSTPSIVGIAVGALAAFALVVFLLASCVFEGGRKGMGSWRRWLVEGGGGSK